MRRKKKAFAFALSVLIVAFLFAGFTLGGDAGKTEATSEGQAEAAFTPSPPAEHSGNIVLAAATEEPDKPEYIPDAAEVEALAKMLYGEARGVPSDMEKAACVWCVLNRVDDPRFPDTVLEVLEAPYQFAGYSRDNPATEELKALAADVLTRYHAERDGETNVGRVLPAEYCFFTGDGKNNNFTIGWLDGDFWQWTLEDPYAD